MPKQKKLDRTALRLIREESWDEAAQLLKKCHPADIADIINRSPPDSYKHVFSLLDDNVKPDVLAELEAVTESDVLKSLTSSEISDIVEEMAPDDAADVLADLPEKRSEEILSLMEEEESKDVRMLLEYDDETAGGIMTTDVVAMRENQTVEEALNAIAYLDTKERFYNTNIVDEANTLIGYVDIWELLREQNKKRPLGELVHRDAPCVSVDTDQEEAARVMSKYDLSVLPVIDHRGALVGRITADDVIDVIEEEASEDIMRLGGTDDAELESDSPIKSCFIRLPWLFITLLGGFVTSLILRQFHEHISGAEIIALAYFVPIVLAMGGNTGIQSSTLIVRRIALGDLKGRSIFALLLREVLIGILMGSVCGLIIGLWAHFMIDSPTCSVHGLSIIVAIALFSAMTFAAIFGALVPVLLHKARVDPAVASGPFVTVTNDISALLIYFAVTLLMIHHLFKLP